MRSLHPHPEAQAEGAAGAIDLQRSPWAPFEGGFGGIGQVAGLDEDRHRPPQVVGARDVQMAGVGDDEAGDAAALQVGLRAERRAPGPGEVGVQAAVLDERTDRVGKTGDAVQARVLARGAVAGLRVDQGGAGPDAQPAGQRRLKAISMPDTWARPVLRGLAIITVAVTGGPARVAKARRSGLAVWVM